MVSTKEFAIALGGVATGILGYAVSKIMGFGNFKNPAIDTAAALGLVGVAVGSQAYLPEEIGHENVLLYANSALGTAGLLKLFDTHSSSLKAGLAGTTGGYVPPSVNIGAQTSQAPSKPKTFQQETPGIFF